MRISDTLEGDELQCGLRRWASTGQEFLLLTATGQKPLEETPCNIPEHHYVGDPKAKGWK